MLTLSHHKPYVRVVPQLLRPFVIRYVPETPDRYWPHEGDASVHAAAARRYADRNDKAQPAGQLLPAGKHPLHV